MILGKALIASLISLTAVNGPLTCGVIDASLSDQTISVSSKPINAGWNLDANQSRNARTIVAVVEQRHLPKRAAVVAIACAWQESKILIWANDNVPQSLDVYHEWSGTDATSVGIFQQEVGPNRQMGFDDAATVMDPVWSTNAFLDRMIEANADWATIPLTQAAQDAQDSGFPDAYAQWEDEAEVLVEAVA